MRMRKQNSCLGSIAGITNKKIIQFVEGEVELTSGVKDQGSKGRADYHNQD